MSRSAKSGPRVSSTRDVEREGLRAVIDLFENNGHVIHEVPGQHDFGRDCFVDLVDQDVVTGLTIGLQVKSGRSYRRPSGDYAIPVDTHWAMWRHSTVPFFGVVYDPDEKCLFWVDLTRELSASTQRPSEVRIPKHSRLDSAKGLEAMLQAVGRHKLEPVDTLSARLLSSDSETQELAAAEVWPLARHSPHAPLLLRRLLLELSPPATLNAIWVISLVIGHFDALYRTTDWVPAEVSERLRSSLRFSADELVHLYSGIDNEQWGRGEVGQALDVIVMKARGLTEDAVIEASKQLLSQGDGNCAARLIRVFAWQQGDGEQLIERLVQAVPGIENGDMMRYWLKAIANGEAFELY